MIRFASPSLTRAAGLFAITALVAALCLGACGAGIGSDPGTDAARLQFVAPRGAVGGSPLEFEQAAVGGTSPPTQLVVRNAGDATSAPLGIELIGGSATSFAMVGEASCVGRRLARDEQCAFAVAFTPTSADEQYATLRVTAGGAPPLAITLHGTGRPTWLTIYPVGGWGPIDLGMLEAGVDTHFAIEVLNNGWYDAKQVTVGATGGAESWLTVGATTCPDVLPRGATCTFDVVARAGTLGPLQGLVTARADGEYSALEVQGVGAGRITVNRTGPGVVHSLPYGIYCSDRCTGLFSEPVVLLATPDAGAELLQWTQPGFEGCAIGNPGTCRVAPRLAPVAVDAVFAVDQTRSLTITASGDDVRATIRVDVDGVRQATTCYVGTTCDLDVEIGQQVVVRVYTASELVGWSRGPCAPQARECALTIEDHVDLALSFRRSERELWTYGVSWGPTSSLVRFARDGAVIVAGAGDIGQGGPTALVRKVGRDRSNVWSTWSPGDRVVGLAVAATGDVLALDHGGAWGGDGLRLRRLRGSDGAEVWSKVIAGASVAAESFAPSRLAVSAAGDVVIAGEIEVAGAPRMSIRSYDLDGRERWSASTEAEGPGSIAISSTGVTHVLVGPPGARTLRRYDRDGALLAPLALPSFASGEDHRSLVIDDADRIVVASTHRLLVLTLAGALLRDTPAPVDAVGPTRAAAGGGRFVQVFDAWTTPSRFRVATVGGDGAVTSWLDERGVPAEEVLDGDQRWVSDVAIAEDGAVAITVVRVHGGLWPYLGELETLVRLYAPAE